uniref:3CxxC-type domain-containing protein n=1 Tax=Periophthalmus magnuspinnatus TaxID=409849 RepID=A0A3B4BKU0_9GOBI
VSWLSIFIILGCMFLACDTEGPLSPRPFRSPDVLLADGSPHLRFLRPMSIYSPMFDRRLFLKQLNGGGDRELDTTELEGSVTEDHSEPDMRLHLASKGPSLQVRLVPFQPDLFTKPYFFQFLEQKYGFFHCKKCNVRWESAYVWCISGTSKVYFKQLCRKCQVGFNPYRVESILCKGCAQTSCICERKQRHINMKRPHRQDLCCRCKGMRLSCDATYSFKYIV